MADAEAEGAVKLEPADAETVVDKLVPLVVRDEETEAERAGELVVPDTKADMANEVREDICEAPLLPLWVEELC